jgi:hypothetical protein
MPALTHECAADGTRREEVPGMRQKDTEGENEWVK